MDLDRGRLIVRTHVDLKFADGEYRFALGLAQIHELQTKCGAGIGVIYARVLQGRVPDDDIGHPLYAAYHANDLVETIRQGLIGGGEGIVDGQPIKVSAMRANDLVERYGPGADGVPLSAMWKLAAAILFAKIEGYEPAADDAAAKKKAPRKLRPKPTTVG